jgi:hypothetical protein
MYDKERKRTRPTPSPPSLPPSSRNPPPPLTPPREGRGGESCLHSIKLQEADSAAHAEITTFSREFGVRAGDI